MVRSLLDAARDVFLDRGLAAATIEEITDRADVGKGTFYIYFSSKAAIFETLVCAAVKRLLSHIRKAVKEAQDLRSAICQLVEAELQYYRQDPKSFRLIDLARALLQLNEVDLADCAQVFENYLRLEGVTFLSDCWVDPEIDADFCSGTRQYRVVAENI